MCSNDSIIDICWMNGQTIIFAIWLDFREVLRSWRSSFRDMSSEHDTKFIQLSCCTFLASEGNWMVITPRTFRLLEPLSIPKCTSHSLRTVDWKRATGKRSNETHSVRQRTYSAEADSRDEIYTLHVAGMGPLAPRSDCSASRNGFTIDKIR